MMQDALIVSAAGGLLCLDRVLIQVLLSRPIVAAPIIGLLLGDPFTGLIVGALIELIWIDRLPIGGYLPPNDTMTSILTTASAIGSGRLLGGLSPGLIALAVLIFIPFGMIAQRMDVWIVMGNERLSSGALDDAVRGDCRAIARKHLLPVLKTFLLSALLILITLPAAIGVITWVYPRLPASILRGLTLVYASLPLIGAAAALNAIRSRGTLPIFCAAFLTATVILGLLGCF
jgi:PTS system mannose-specific IIC component